MKSAILGLLISTSALAGQAPGQILGAPSVGTPHFVEISQYADPVNAFVDSVLNQREIYIESKFAAAMVDKIKDDNTDSGLYSEYRSVLKDRGIYDNIKSIKDIPDTVDAKTQAIAFYQDFLKELHSQNNLEDFLETKADRDEIFSADTSLNSHDEIVAFMNPNPDAYQLKSGEIKYYGLLPASAIGSLFHNEKKYSLHAVGKSIIALKHKLGAVCNQDMQFFDCATQASISINQLSLAGILSKKADKIDMAKIAANFPVKTKSDIADLFNEIKLYDSAATDSYIPLVPVRQTAIASHLLNTDPKFDAVNEIIKKDHKYLVQDIQEVYYQPTLNAELEVAFDFSKELRLLPNQTVYLVLPDHVDSKAISSIILAHRQNPRDQRGSMSYNPATGVKTYDDWPAYTSVQVHSVNHSYNNAWRGWGGHVSSDKRSKFAEIKKSPEFDNLYEWPLKGHHSIATDKKESSLLKGNLIKLEVLGDDPVYIAGVQIKLVPPLADHYEEHSYTYNRTSLGDPITMQGRVYGGGGSRYGGKFPGAHVLSPHRRGAHKLVIPTNGRNVRAIDLAIGDTKPDGVRNRDGGIGSLGGSRISIFVETNSGKQIQLIDRENVSPQGVITTYNNINSVKNIIIRVHSDTSYLMGYRYGYDD